MTTNRDLSQKIEELKTKLSDTLEEIEALEIEQSLIENERLIDVDEKSQRDRRTNGNSIQNVRSVK